MIYKQTGVQRDEAETDTDDFITRKYVLPILADEETRNRIISEHKANPVGKPGKDGRPAQGHSDELIRVLDKLRRHPMEGKYVSVCIQQFKDYRIGVCSGIRGESVKILDDASFSSEEACEHAIFLKRITDLLKQYGISI